MPVCCLCGANSAPDPLKHQTFTLSSCLHERCGQCVEIAKVEEELAALQESVVQHLEKRRHLFEQHNGRHDIFRRKLPLELIEAVFKYCLPKSDLWGHDSWNGDDAKKTKLPLALGWVSRSWREAAWSIPSLWDSIVVRLDARDPIAHGSILVDWLARSGSRPISLTVKYQFDDNRDSWDPDYDYISDEYLKSRMPIVDPVNDASPRWRTLELKLTPVWYAKFTGKGGPLQLETLRLCPRGYDGTLARIPFQLEAGPPSPTNLVMRNAVFDCLKINWDNLTSAFVTNVNETGLYSLLNSAPQLRLLALCNIISHGSLSALPLATKITHSNLCRISMRGFTGGASFLLRLILPKLYWFTSENADLVLDPRQLADMVDRSSCSLQTIKLEAQVRPHRLCSLPPFPSVTELLLDAEVDETFCQLISTRSSPELLTGSIQTSILPSLRRLKVGASVGFPWWSIPGLFVNNADHRTNGRQPLEWVSISCPLRFERLDAWMDEETARMLWTFKNQEPRDGTFIIATAAKPEHDLLGEYIDMLDRRDKEGKGKESDGLNDHVGPESATEE